ncbi:MAG: PDZ domain-containing protein, partial [Acinetobacter sp.]
DYSASAGIVSAKSRNMLGENAIPFIQTDVALNRGNSGGPLFNQRGEVVGVNSRIFSGTGGYMGLSFSIPIDVAMRVVDQIRTKGKVTRPYLGVMLQDIDRDLAESYQLAKPEGALITQVTPNSPASKAGLKAGDIILKYNGLAILRTSTLLNQLHRAIPQQHVQLEILRENQRRNVNITLVAAPDDTPTVNTRQASDQGAVLGVVVRGLTTDEAQPLQIKGGVLLQRILANGLAAASQLQAGDVVYQVNQQEIIDAVQFIQVVKSLKKPSVARFSVIRNGSRGIVGVRIQ